jgi:hypothetical protein
MLRCYISTRSFLPVHSSITALAWLPFIRSRIPRITRNASRATNLLAALNPRLVFALVTTTFLPSKDTRGLIGDARACLRNFKRRAIERNQSEFSEFLNLEIDFELKF